MNMPMYAALVAFPLAMIPGADEIYKDEDSILGGSVIAGLVIVGNSAVVIILLILGTSLA
jgi:hypothetical protein